MKMSRKSASPIKRASTAKHYIAVDKEVIRGLSTKEVEIEHLKTALYAVSTKLEVTHFASFIRC
jgi:hypothetical protein